MPPTPVPRRVLVVDDHSNVAQMLADLIARDGHRVDIATDGQAALERIAAAGYDLVIADHDMPLVDGLGLYAALERHHPDLRDRFVLITGSVAGPTAERIAAFLARTGVPVLAKPFRLGAFEAVIERMLPGHHAGAPGTSVTLACPLCLDADGRAVPIVAAIDLSTPLPTVGDLSGCPHAEAFGQAARLRADEERRLVEAALDAWNARGQGGDDGRSCAAV